jgi:hypothetical protein
MSLHLKLHRIFSLPENLKRANAVAMIVSTVFGQITGRNFKNTNELF